MNYQRPEWKYRIRALRYCYFDTGHAVANFIAVGRGLGLNPKLFNIFSDARLHHLLGLQDEKEEGVLCLL
ncbi:MAG: SagB/ThcOx family dehydrogenase, partial [bacterium]